MKKTSEKIRRLKKNEKAVTLVALVISIIVLIILSAVTFNLTVGNNGIITRSFEARYMMQLSSFQEELGSFKAVKLMDNDGFLESSITSGENSLIYNTQPEGEGGNIYDVITSLKDSNFAGKLEIIKGEIVLNSTDEIEIKAAQAVGIEVNPYIIVDGELTSSGANLALMDKNGTLTIPEGVEKIGKGAFANLSGLKTIIIPGTVKEIGANAFRNNVDLETVILQEGVEVIGDSAFQECSNLKNIELPESLTEIREYAFYLCTSLDNVKIPSKIEAIEYYTFNGCDNLTEIKLPEHLLTMSSYSFASCINLEKIYIPSSVSNIEDNVFSNCTKLKNIEIGNENQKYRYDIESGMLITIDGANIIFISNEILKDTNVLNIPEGVTSFVINISNYTNITTIRIPVSLKTIGAASIFPTTINNIEILENNDYFMVEDGCLYNKDKTILFICFTKDSTIKLSSTLVEINSYAFRLATNLTEINIPNLVTKLNSRIIDTTNTKLENIKIGPNVTVIDPLFKYMNYYGTVTIDEKNQKYSIENNEIYNKSKTELITVLYKINGQYIIREGVTKISERALYNQYSMTGITLPEGMKEIADSAFGYCNNLTTIYIPNTVETIASNAFENAANLTKIQIDKEPGSISGSPWGAIRGDRIVEWLREN